jgi:hypothetical protein
MSCLFNIVQDIIRVNAAHECKPKYRPVYWNCHDIGVFFAYLATSGQTRLDLTQRLVRQFLSAKLRFQRIVNTTSSASRTLLSQLMNILKGAAYIPVTIAAPVIGTPLLTRKMYRELESWLYAECLIDSVIVDRMNCICVLRQRFSSLHNLRPPSEWEDHEKSYEWLRNFRTKWWFYFLFPSLLITNMHSELY